jgi:hypothetical protein
MRRVVAIVAAVGCRDDAPPRAIGDYVLGEGTAHRAGAELAELYCGTIRGVDGRVVGWMASFGNRDGAFAQIYAPGFHGDGTYKVRYTSAGRRTGVDAVGAYDLVLDGHGHHGLVQRDGTQLELRCFDGDDTRANELPAPELPTSPGTAWVVDEIGGLFMFDGVSCASSPAGLAIATEAGPRQLAIQLPAVTGVGRYRPSSAGWSFHASADTGDGGEAMVAVTSTSPAVGTFTIAHGDRESHGGFTCPRGI